MLNKRKETGPWIYMSICVFIILLGIVMIVNAFSQTRKELMQEHNEHLTDIARSADRNIANILDRCRIELEYTVDRCSNSAKLYSISGERATLIDHLAKLPAVKSNYVSGILFVDGGAVITQIPGEGPLPDYDFFYEDPSAGISLCRDDDGRAYLAVSQTDEELGFRYVVLLELHQLYEMILGDDLGDNYWMGLYDPDSGLFLQTDDDYLLAMQIVPEAAKQRRGGIASLVSVEQSGRTDTKGYIFVDEIADTSQQRLISVIPTKECSNQAFAVGVSVESSHYFDMIHNLVWRIVAYALIILLAVCVMLSLLYRHRRKNHEIREQVDLLEEQNRSMQELVDKTRELAHHQRLEMIGTMTSSIAHEFNNLLTPIMGYSLMTMEAMPEGCEELFDNVAEIYEASFRAKTLVSRLSGLSRKNSEATSRLLSPDSIMTKVRDVAQPSVPRMVTVTQALNCPEPCLYGDETQLCQLALNLIINAFQAMEEKGGSLTISTALEGEQIVMRFTDTGPGMTPEVVEHIFEPFYTTKDVSRGTGLGLAIVKQTVESHNGTIEVDSVVGRGTTFTVRFPRHREE